MSNTIPDSHKDLLEKPVYVQLATHMPDGSINLNPVWCSYDGERIWVNSARGRAKDKNMRTNPNVTINAMDSREPFHYLEVRGLVEEITEEGADDHINALSEQYLNKPYPYRQEGEVRVIYKIRPQRVIAFAF